MAILGLNALPAQSQILGFDKRLRRRAVLNDIYVNISGLFNNNTGDIPNAAYMEVENAAIVNTHTATVTMKLPIVSLPVVGNARYNNTEISPQTKAGTIYRNNYGLVVNTEKYGVRKLDQEPYGLYKEHINDLGMWAKQYEGLEVRQGYCEVFGYSLWWGDTAATCQPQINQNVFVQGATDANQPAYDLNPITHANNIVASILSAGGGALTPTNAQAASFRLFNRIAMRALTLMLWPLQVGQKQAFVFVCSPLFASIYADPTWQNSGGAQWIQFTNLPKEIQNWYGVHGVFHSSIGVDIIIVVDQKCPTVLPSGTGGAGSLLFGYVEPGDFDHRHLTDPNVRDCNLLIGQGGLMLWDPEKLHFITEDDNYGKYAGNGVAGVRGIQQCRYNWQVATTAGQEYYGSMLVLTARPAYQ